MAYVDLDDVQIPAEDDPIEVAWGLQARANFEALRKPKFALAGNGLAYIPDGGSPHVVTLATELYDPYGMFTPGEDHITLGETGLWVITASALWDAWPGGRRYIDATQNGTVLGAVSGPPDDGGDCAHQVVIPIQPYTAGDLIRVELYQDSGATVSVSVNLNVEMRGTL